MSPRASFLALEFIVWSSGGLLGDLGLEMVPPGRRFGKENRQLGSSGGASTVFVVSLDGLSALACFLSVWDFALPAGLSCLYAEMALTASLTWVAGRRASCWPDSWRLIGFRAD